jgi:hypothetical protein
VDDHAAIEDTIRSSIGREEARDLVTGLMREFERSPAQTI